MGHGRRFHGLRQSSLHWETMFSLSKPESAFIEAGVEKGVRNDGRARLDYRSLHLETGVVPTAHGSARVRLDRTHVVVGVKLEVAEPAADAPDRGYIYCSVECSATASDMFMRQGSQDANTELTGAMQRFYESCLDLGALAIIPGRSVWAVFIDVEILDTDGSALDAASAGVRAAVRTAQVPCIHLVGSTDRDEGRDFEVSPDPIDSTRLPADLVPICVSMTKVAAADALFGSSSSDVAGYRLGGVSLRMQPCRKSYACRRKSVLL